MTVRMDGDVLALTFAKDGTVTPDVSRGFIIKVEGGPTKGRLAYFFFLPSAVSAPPEHRYNGLLCAGLSTYGHRLA